MGDSGIPNVLSGTQRYDITNVEPTQNCSFTVPELGDPVTDGFVQQIELFIPAHIYSNNYKSITQMNRARYPAAVNNYLNALELFGFLSTCLNDYELDDGGAMTKTRKIHLELVREDSNIYEEARQVIERQNSNPDANSDFDEIDFVRNLFRDPEYLHKRNMTRIIAFRLRITLISKKYSFAAIINQLTLRNSARDAFGVRKGNQTKKRSNYNSMPTPFYHDMTKTSYAQLCSWYTANPNINASGCSQNIWENDNPINPLNVFSLQRSMDKARNLKCDIFSCQLKYYISESPRVEVIATPMFPVDFGDKSMKQKKKKKKENAEFGLDAIEEEEEQADEGMDQHMNNLFADRGGGGEKKENAKMIHLHLPYLECRYPYFSDVFELESQCIIPGNLSKYILPHRRAFNHINDKDLDAYIRENVGTLETSGLSEEEYNQKRLDIIKAYSNTVTCSIDNTEKMDIDKLKSTVEHVELELKRFCGDNLSEFGILWEKARRPLFEQFLTIFSSDGNCGDAIKAIAKWGDEYIATNETFCLPFEKQTTNLTLFEDQLIVRAAQQEVYQQTSVAHIESESQMVKMLHVYSGYALNPNIINIGEGDSGKSRMVDAITQELIPGTWEKINLESPQARLADGNMLNYMIEIWDDVPAVLFGVRNENGKSDPEADKRGALLKPRLTDGKLTVYRKVIDENGKHLLVKSRSDCKSVINGCINYLPPGQYLDEATYSRFCVRDSDLPRRADGVTTCNKNQITTNKQIEIGKFKKFTRMRRSQYLIAMIGQLVYCGLLKMDMSGARILNDQILTKAKQRGLTSTDKPRNYHFVECCERVLTQWKAVVECFDSYGSEFIKWDENNNKFIFEKWRPEHIFSVEKYLVCTKELVSLSFGYMENQFETPAFQKVKQIIKDEMSKPERRNPIASTSSSTLITSTSVFPTSSSFSSPAQPPAPLNAPRPVTNPVNFTSILSGLNNNPKIKPGSGTGAGAGVNPKSSTSTSTSHAATTAAPAPAVNQQSLYSYMNQMNAQVLQQQSQNLSTMHQGTGFHAQSNSWNNNNNGQSSFGNYEHNVKKYDAKEDGYINIYFRPETNITSTYFREAEALRYMKANILPVMSEKAIKRAVETLKKMTLAADPFDDSNLHTIPALKFGVNCWKVATNLFSNPVQNVLRSCVKEVLSFKGAPNQDVLYGKPNVTALHIYEVLHIRPSETAEPLIHRDYGFMDQQMIGLASADLDSVKINVGRASQEMVEAVIKPSDDLINDDGISYERANQKLLEEGFISQINFSTAFSKYAYLKVDCDIDKVSIYNHAQACALHESELSHCGPPVHPIEHAIFLLENFTIHDNSIEYPNGLELFTNPEYITNLSDNKVIAQIQVNQQLQVLRGLYSGDKKEEVEKRDKLNDRIRHFSYETDKKKLWFLSKKNQSRPVVRSSATPPPRYGPSSFAGENVSQYKKKKETKTPKSAPSVMVSSQQSTGAGAGVRLPTIHSYEHNEVDHLFDSQSHYTDNEGDEVSVINNIMSLGDIFNDEADESRDGEAGVTCSSGVNHAAITETDFPEIESSNERAEGQPLVPQVQEDEPGLRRVVPTVHTVSTMEDEVKSDEDSRLTSGTPSPVQLIGYRATAPLPDAKDNQQHFIRSRLDTYTEDDAIMSSQ